MTSAAMTRILILSPSSSYRTGDFIEAAGRFGAQVVVGTDQALVVQGLARDIVLKLDFSDPEFAASQIVSSHSEQPFDALIGVDETASLIAAIAAGRLGLPHNSPQSVRAAHNKYDMRRAIVHDDVLSPAFQLMRLDENLDSIARDVSYPCVLKPLGLSASRGVVRANDPGEFVIAARRIQKILAEIEDLAPDLRGSVLVEDFVPGREVALEGLLTDGRLQTLALFDKPDALDGPYFEETLYITPSRLSQAQRTTVERTTSAACRELGLVTGPIHAELRINSSGAWLIELAARSIGGRCSRSLSFADGISLEELIIGQALGQTLPDTKPAFPASGVMMIPIPGSGVLRAVRGVECARAIRGVTELVIEPLLGQRLVPLPEGDRYLGFIFARGCSPQMVEATLKSAHSTLQFDLEQIPCTPDLVTRRL